MTDEERERLEALWRPTLVEVDGLTYVCGAVNVAPPRGGFVWLTSDEPDGRPIDDRAVTAARRRALHAELDRRGWGWSSAPSRSPDGAHEELGVAVHGVARESAMDLARTFGQLAVFIVDEDGAMHVAWCA